MKLWFRQMYIEVGASYPFDTSFQQFLSREVSSRVVPSDAFCRKFGEEFELMFTMSAKHGIATNEVCGPAVYRKAKDVEYSIFLPYDVIARSPRIHHCALEYLFLGVYHVLESLMIDTGKLRESQGLLIDQIMSDPEMMES